MLVKQKYFKKAEYTLSMKLGGIKDKKPHKYSFMIQKIAQWNQIPIWNRVQLCIDAIVFNEYIPAVSGDILFPKSWQVITIDAP